LARLPTENLESFLRRQDLPTLIAILLELAADHDAVRSRIERLQLSDRPDKLAAGFRRTLAGWRRARRFLPLREAREFARQLDTWLEQVRRELLPKDPAAALALFEAFIECDSTFFERADDSDGCIGTTLHAATMHWLEAAAHCDRSAGEWLDRIDALVGSDGYGIRGELLRQANLLLDEPTLRALAVRYQRRMDEALSTAPGPGLPSEVFMLSGALSLLAEALRDPDVHVCAVLAYSPRPNELQKRHFVEAYLAAGRPGDALTWLEGSWDRFEESRLGLTAAALGQLGRAEESASILRSVFERSLAVIDLQHWLDRLPEGDRPAALQQARRLALACEEPMKAATLLMQVGDDESAEAKLLAASALVNGERYEMLTPLAHALGARGRLRGETVIYRALLTAILERGYARAYGYAAKYWARLQDIGATGLDLRPLESHAAFEAATRLRHGRKSSFWSRVTDGRGRGR
jgi:hypothetical protein